MLTPGIETAIARIAAVEPPQQLCLLESCSSHATGAVILHAWATHERHPRIVVKTPRNPRLSHGLQREWDAVTTVRTESSLARLVPAPVETLTEDGVDYFVYQGVPGRTMSSWARRRVLASRERMLRSFAEQALEMAVVLHNTDSRPATPDEIARDLLTDLAWLETSVPSLPPGFSQQARIAAATIAASGQSLPLGRVHGDFTPHNFMVRSAVGCEDAMLIDWEHTEPQRPQHLDVFRFMFVCGLMGLRGSARKQAFDSVSSPDNPLLHRLLRPWLQRMETLGAEFWMQPRACEALWWHFWIHAARREQERLGRLASSREAMSLHSLTTLVDR